METPKLDWSSAEVRDGKLTVPLEVDGQLPKDWKRRFERTVSLLDRGDWGGVAVKKGAVSVTGLEPGDEDRLHHFLESVVQEANTVVEVEETDEHDDEDEPEQDGDERDDGSDSGSGDQEMTDRFRSFSDA